MPYPKRLPLPDAELSRQLEVLAQRFVQQWSLYSRQLDDGRRVCVHEPLNVGLLFDHLRGEITLGAYLLDQQSRARFIVLDADDEPSWQRLEHVAKELADEGIPAYLERSRRGGHLWLFLAEAVSGQEARSFGQGLLAAHQVEEVELLPKQDELADGPGSLIRMPLGVHRLTGRCHGFCTAAGFPLASTIREQIAALGPTETVPEAALEACWSLVSPQSVKAHAKLLERLTNADLDTGMISERVKASVTVLEFASPYVDLKATVSGTIGLCPFHDDLHPSFGVNDRRNR